MWQILRSRYWRVALAGGLLVALITSLVVVAPLRTAAVQFLRIFRSWESANSKVYSTPENTKDFYGRVFTKTRTTDVRQTGVTSLEQASQLSGFRVLMPAYLPEGMEPISISQVLLISAHAYRVEVNLPAARAMLQAAGLPTDAISVGKDRVQVTAEIEPSVVIHQSQGPRWFTLIQARNPAVTVPEGSDSAQLRELDELGLRYLGLSQADARQISQRMDWASFLVVPQDEMSLAEPVSINGHSGYRLRRTELDNDYKAVIWEAEGVLYSIHGGLSATELIAMAESLE